MVFGRSRLHTIILMVGVTSGNSEGGRRSSTEFNDLTSVQILNLISVIMRVAEYQGKVLLGV